ncbi:hypothetical protein EFK50_16650 [Nocardioides marmoriginsengisoli]|uniref:Uncharacterized protein n=1 Tax=Nocardioides marmoriginsengisoli TaxID=661483 RepID=A0A3N0CD83_9ACTN|nr:hypothetical protein EFK50_16650 [Nocardioides marmoriginsengisoli]
MTKKKYLAAGVAVAVFAGGGIAFAYWTSTGSGTGTATTGTSSVWDVQVDEVDLDNLTPGGPTNTIPFSVQNDNSGVQRLQNTVASVVDTSDPGCTSDDFTVSATTITYGDVASGATVNGTFTVQMIDTGSNQDACKGVTVNLKVDAS